MWLEANNEGIWNDGREVPHSQQNLTNEYIIKLNQVCTGKPVVGCISKPQEKWSTVRTGEEISGVIYLGPRESHSPGHLGTVVVGLLAICTAEESARC